MSETGGEIIAEKAVISCTAVNTHSSVGAIKLPRAVIMPRPKLGARVHRMWRKLTELAAVVFLLTSCLAFLLKLVQDQQKAGQFILRLTVYECVRVCIYSAQITFFFFTSSLNNRLAKHLLLSCRAFLMLFHSSSYVPLTLGAINSTLKCVHPTMTNVIWYN